MKKKLRVFDVYCDSLFYTLHSRKLKSIKHWAGPICNNVQVIQFYSESDAMEALKIIKSTNCKVYRKVGSVFRNNIQFEEIG